MCYFGAEFFTINFPSITTLLLKHCPQICSGRSIIHLKGYFWTVTTFIWLQHRRSIHDRINLFLRSYDIRNKGIPMPSSSIVCLSAFCAHSYHSCQAHLTPKLMTMSHFPSPPYMLDTFPFNIFDLLSIFFNWAFSECQGLSWAFNSQNNLVQ